jgi:uncharacterized membrane protein YjjP (DUF1212 family)
MLQDILNRSQHGLAARILAYSLVSCFFTLLFEGNLKDSAAAALIGAFICLVIAVMQHVDANTFFVNILCGMTITILSQWMVSWQFGDHPDKIMIGVLMTLVPGISLANCMRTL